MLAVNSTVLSDGQGLKHLISNLEFFTIHANLSSRMQQDDGLQSFFRLIASAQPSSQLAKKPIESTSPECEVSGMSCAEDLDSASLQSSPPKSDFSPAKEEMSREWMYSWILTLKTDEEWMLTRTRKVTLTLEDCEFIETMGDAIKET